jgi:hypothetical protein
MTDKRFFFVSLLFLSFSRSPSSFSAGAILLDDETFSFRSTPKKKEM